MVGLGPNLSAFFARPFRTGRGQKRHLFEDMDWGRRPALNRVPVLWVFVRGQLPVVSGSEKPDA